MESKTLRFLGSGSPTGMAFIYLSEDGYFIREMIELEVPVVKKD